MDTDKIQQAMNEVDRQFDAARPMITTTVAARSNGPEPATLISWLKRFDDRQLDLERKLSRIISFLGAVEK
jgi:hypothetical protein